MNHYRNPFPRLALAVLFGLALMGCSPPANAATINLDKRTTKITKFSGTDTLIATRGNLYQIDHVDPATTFLATDPSVAVLMIDPRNQALILDARNPGTSDLYYQSGGKLMRLQVVVTR